MRSSRVRPGQEPRSPVFWVHTAPRTQSCLLESGRMCRTPELHPQVWPAQLGGRRKRCDILCLSVEEASTGRVRMHPAPLAWPGAPGAHGPLRGGRASPRPQLFPGSSVPAGVAETGRHCSRGHPEGCSPGQTCEHPAGALTSIRHDRPPGVSWSPPRAAHTRGASSRSLTRRSCSPSVGRPGLGVSERRWGTPPNSRFLV